jgi:hypothetical protein
LENLPRRFEPDQRKVLTELFTMKRAFHLFSLFVAFGILHSLAPFGAAQVAAGIAKDELPNAGFESDLANRGAHAGPEKTYRIALRAEAFAGAAAQIMLEAGSTPGLSEHHL